MIENSIYTSILPVAYSGYINRGKACSDPLKIRSYKWSVEEMKVEEDEEWEGDETTLVNTYGMILVNTCKISWVHSN